MYGQQEADLKLYVSPSDTGAFVNQIERMQFQDEEIGGIHCESLVCVPDCADILLQS